MIKLILKWYRGELVVLGRNQVVKMILQAGREAK
jgi:hypothetical protein